MTDFIHEHPKDEQPAAPTPPPESAEEAPLDERTGQKRVYGYIFILFIVAFALLLWAFLMNQRSNDEVLSELRGSTDTLQSALNRNIVLEQQVETLEKEVKNLETEVEELQERGKALADENAALTEERDALQNALEEAQDALKVYEDDVENP